MQPTPEAANCESACTQHSGLGCGSPIALAGLAPGEWVLDLGSGAGFDCLAAALEVGSRGRVVGIDMTPEMVRLARRHAGDAGVAIVHFLQGEIENLPFADASFDVVVSNCVINLCAEKERVFAEACRVLKPDGRLAVADIVAAAPLPEDVQSDLELHTACMAGATELDSLSRMLGEAGFVSIEIDLGAHSDSLLDDWAPGLDLKRFVAAANISARKATPWP
jgi:ubiquinone/menaquinone biosynthesis C-methylase UbiE